MTASTWTPSGEIPGLTDRPRLPRLGKIRLGIKKQGQHGEYPSAVDHFVVPEVVQRVYGAKPRELDIVFPTDEVARVAGAFWKMYTATRGKVCTGDGERAVRIIDLDKLSPAGDHSQDEMDAALVTATSKNWERREIFCPAHDCVFAKKGHCKAVMNLLFLLPKVQGVGVWQLDTSSVNSILDVRGGIQLVQKLTGGPIAGVPLKLRVEPTDAYPEGRKKVVFTLKLVSPATLGKVLAAGEQNLRALLIDEETGTPVALPEPRQVPPPEEPEADLYPASVVTPNPQREEADEAPIEAAAARGSAAPSTPEPLKRDRAAEDSGRTSTEPPAAQSEVDVAAQIEQLFEELNVPAKERGMWRKNYEGRAAALLKMLQHTAKTKGAKR